MKIFIPMAGHSRRFKKAGYDTLKPFIPIDGKPMIERVCAMFSPNDEFIFACNRDHLRNASYRNILENITQFFKIVEIDPHEKGPVYSILEAEEAIDNANEPFIISYCDFSMQWDYRRFLMKAAQYEGAIPVFKGFHPASFGDTYYAYLRANENMEMLELREKKSFTQNRVEEYASTGVYYLESWNTFLRYASALLTSEEKELPEYYCSLLYNPMVSDGKRVCLFEVEKFICMGTPEDLREYIFWSEYFSKNANQISQGELI